MRLTKRQLETLRLLAARDPEPSFPSRERPGMRALERVGLVEAVFDADLMPREPFFAGFRITPAGWDALRVLDPEGVAELAIQARERAALCQSQLQLKAWRGRRTGTLGTLIECDEERPNADFVQWSDGSREWYPDSWLMLVADDVVDA